VAVFQDCYFKDATVDQQSPTKLKTCFYDYHLKHGAKMVDFAGWEMPLHYSAGIVAEHQHTRQAMSIFDVSHMGRLKITGKGAQPLLEHVCTRKIGGFAPGRSGYSLLCNEDGGVLDDVIVSRFERHWLMVCNASNREAIIKWLQTHAARFDAKIEDETFSTAMVSVQGPKAIEYLDTVLPEPASDIKRYQFQVQNYLIASFSVFRTGYTGEDGVEIICGKNVAQMAVNFIAKSGEDKPNGLKPAGLGARDTLRLEAGMPLYGHELTPTIDPISAGLDWAVAIDKPFIGSDAIERIRLRGPERLRVGLEITGQRIARQGAKIKSENDEEIGEVTSGTLSPTLQKVIAMGYVQPPYVAVGTDVLVDIRGTHTPAKVVALPFYRR
jgi:aminomethyltransferase